MYKSIIDEALAKARNVASTFEKTASVGTPTDLVKEAEDLAGALEFISLSSVGESEGGRAVLSDFFKAAAQGGPAESVTRGGGTQPSVPSAGRTHIPTGDSGARPAESVAPAGSLSRDLMAQPPAGTKKAGATSLFDLISGESEKMAARPGQGPADSLAGQDSAAPPARNENTNLHLLRSNTAPVEATKRQAKLPTRDRLKALWAGASDTTGDATAKAIWPQASTRGSMKVAGNYSDGNQQYRRGYNKQKQSVQARGMSMQDRLSMRQSGAQDMADGARKTRRGDTIGGAAFGGIPGALIGYAAGHDLAHDARAGFYGEKGIQMAERHGGKAGLAGAAIVGGLGAAAFGKALHSANKRQEARAQAEVDDPQHMRAEMSKTLGTKRRIQSDAKLQAQVAAARRGEKVSRPLISIKKGSALEWAQVFDALLEGEAGEEAQAFAQSIEGMRF
jgi:hypothetical protein